MTEVLPRPRPVGLSLPIVASAVFHAALLTATVLGGSSAGKPMPPIYKVQLLAAPTGERAEGVIAGPPKVAPATKAPPAPASKRIPETMRGKRSVTPTKAATPNVAAQPAAAPPPKAGGGETGGRGADVANVNTVGIEFPFPGYLNNIVRQMVLAFDVPNGSQNLSAEVSFLIRRDGTVTGIRLLTSSRAYLFDQSALAAVEAVGRSGKLGPLPREFSDDVLPVIFSFDPKRM